MVAITSGKLLITGGSGYVGAWIVKSAVDRGYSVVAAPSEGSSSAYSVRTDAHGQFLVNRFPEYQGKVSYVLVPAIEKDGAYDEAVKDVDAIIPCCLSCGIQVGRPPRYRILTPPSTYGTSTRLVIKRLAFQIEVLRPAIRGALGILESAHKFGKNIKRIVLTSSIAAVGDAIERDGKRTVWNTPATTQFEALGKDTNPAMVYAASKTYAEQSSWAWIKEQKPSWDLVTILPPFIWGPYIHQPAKPHFGSSPGLLLDRIFTRPDTSGANYDDSCDVRDTANIHVLALENPDAGGERVLVSTDSFAWQDIYDIFHSAGFPNVNVPGKTTRGAGKQKTPSATSTAKGSQVVARLQVSHVRVVDQGSGRTVGEGWISHYRQ
ncbi:hypothetical protein BS47DRAFT_1359638 [Hydnum rufescens UP504]|uniref:NAD-dependent epimerase/dehydratase domain-containing protein n=1 Tax=Hydnum rufescens UP504 TaxID=1448309 RepID=A0A9P6DZT5_9AGAM|nr:hypothetical protein BS47DRAFT_1359638 [Hydnum rufescens UP504]